MTFIKIDFPQKRLALNPESKRIQNLSSQSKNYLYTHRFSLQQRMRRHCGNSSGSVPKDRLHGRVVKDAGVDIEMISEVAY